MNILGLLLLTNLSGINVLSFLITDVGGGTCEDRVKCSTLQSDMCSNPLLQEYAAANCAKYCNICPCEDLVKCSTLQSDLCSNPLLAKYAAAYCPKHCNICQSTVAPTTSTPCIDADDRCPGLKDYCQLPYVAANCTLTCNLCPANTQHETVQNPSSFVINKRAGIANSQLNSSSISATMDTVTNNVLMSSTTAGFQQPILPRLLMTLPGLNVLSFVLNDAGEVKEYCLDVSEYNCSLLDCNKFPYEASKFCPRKCELCRTCENRVQCSTLQSDLCTNPLLLQYAAVYCPQHCHFCTPCIDADIRCPGLKDYCHLPYVAANCTLTCKQCLAFNPHEFVQNHYSGTVTTKAGTVDLQSSTASTSDATTKFVTTSRTAVVTSTQQPTLPPLAVKNCDRLGVILEVAKGSIVAYPGTRRCPDGIHQPAEGLIRQLCGAPDLAAWSKGEKVLANCERIPHYTPIAAVTSDFGGSAISGVFVKCETGGFQAAIQTCQSELKIVHVTNSPTTLIPSADKFFILNW